MDIKNPFGSRKGSGMDETFRNLVRFGKVSSVNPSLVAARVEFEDKGGMVSHPLPIIVPGSLKNKHYHLPDVGEDVVCLFLPNGIQRGFVLGSFFNVNNPAPVSSPDKEHVTFSDGTVVEYDRGSHTLTVAVQGTINLTAAGGDIKVGGISLVHHTHPDAQGGNTGEPV